MDDGPLFRRSRLVSALAVAIALLAVFVVGVVAAAEIMVHG